ncbi:MAG TPA: TIGR03986 family CRISPR-associated RAMP protein, partial [Anaerolineae bacterium]|nr:TIGR03986 family CRISPR-associated RAMP protein [Anaerolineae bacterium]
MNPKHTDEIVPRHIPENKKRGVPPYDVYARAPYNFVPLPEQVVTVGEPPDHDMYQGNTGCIDCELVTQSPLYVRGMMTQSSFEEIGDKSFDKLTDAQKQERAKFFMLRDNEPVIPGSSLRGMLRALVEIVGYGKVQPVSKEPLIYRAVGDTSSLGDAYRERLMRDDGNKYYTPLMQAGYLERKDGRWAIRPAKMISGTTFARIFRKDIPRGLQPWHNCKNAHLVWVKLGQYDYQPVRDGFIHIKYAPAVEARASAAPDFQEAVIAYSGPMNKKAREAVVFPPDTDGQPVEIDNDLLRRFKEQISPEQERLLGKDGALIPHQPVFYLMEQGKLVFFGHLWMFRLPYLHTAQDFVPERLRRESDIDLAEALFGYTKQSGEGKQRAYASRVFVSNAALAENQSNVWLTADNAMITPQILSSPKPPTFQHYLVQADAENKKNLKHYASTTPDETVIRGHKVYWHKGDVTRQDIELEADKDRQQLAKQLTGIKPVRAGVSFKFRVHFENLSDAELGALLWVLDLPEGRSQSLGMGKPLGMGAVKITPTLYLSQREERYCKLFEDGAWASGIALVSNQAQYKDAFEKFMLEKLDAADKGVAQSFRDVERIQMLLKLLEFPGPDKNWTRNMEIERNNGYPEPKVNEFKERPVLPDPLNIKPTGEQVRTSSKPASQPKPFAPPQQRGQQQSAPKPKEKLQGAQTKTRPPATKPSMDLPEIGATFTGNIVEIFPDGGVLVQYKNMPIKEVAGYIAAKDRGNKQYAKGNPAKCEVIG